MREMRSVVLLVPRGDRVIDMMDESSWRCETGSEGSAISIPASGDPGRTGGTGETPEARDGDMLILVLLLLRHSPSSSTSCTLRFKGTIDSPNTESGEIGMRWHWVISGVVHCEELGDRLSNPSELCAGDDSVDDNIWPS